MALYMLMMLMASACYGFVSPILRLSYAHGFSASAMTDIQYVIAFVVLWVIALFTPRGARIRGKQWWLILAIGLANAAVSYCYYQALTVLPASFGIILLFQFAWMTVVMDIIVKRKWPSAMKWIGLAIIFVGTGLAVGMKRGEWQHMPLWAVGLGLLSALSYAMNLYLSEYNDPAVSPQLRSALVVTVAMLLIFIPFPPGSMLRAMAHPGIYYWGGWVALLSQILPTLLILIAIPRIGGRMAGVLGTIELPTAVVGAWLINQESITWLRWSGVGLILLGILVSEVVQTPKLSRRTKAA
ncbi:EamA family transporter [Alicyclobacillus fastidiosus]|uniref:EamA family transporter n=1 Tax=Alicyclobacillus fastidiosus TaxID=392011 RepID=A0ABV5AF62_9BACL|nr:EamA family transporter [Alicyclobacillus fastidiosus]WEH09393.1 EamA family transporter [Alicyclobacillus fastidiosus]